MDFFSLDNINIDALQPLLDIFPDGWFDDVRQLYGESLSDEMISQSVEEACDFFHIEEPAIVSEGWTTGVYPNNDFTLQDDVLIFNREQLLDMGISGKDGLDLVMTHEGTHRMLQGMEHLEFDSHQEELCCDYMAGVRAGLNGIDVSQMENSLMYTPESETYPAGVERVEAIEAGVRFAQEYYAEYNMAPTFNECLDNFCELNEFDVKEQMMGLIDDTAFDSVSENTALDSADELERFAVDIESSSSVDMSHPSFGSKDINKENKEWAEWHTDKAKEAYDQEAYHMKRAEEAAKRGDDNAMKDHVARAKSWHNTAKDHADTAKIYKSKIK